MPIKKVTFGGVTAVHEVPKEDRCGLHWILDRIRFEQRVKNLENLFDSLSCEGRNLSYIKRQ